MQFTAEMIASFLEGDIVGQKDVVVSKVAKIEQGESGSLSFLSNPKYEHYLYTTQSSIVIVSRDLVPSQEVAATMIKVDDPYASFASLLDLYIASRPQKEGVSERSSVAEGVEVPEDIYIGEFVSIGMGVKLGKEVKLYPNVVIGDNVTIGDNVKIYPNVTIYEECVIKDNVIIHSGAVIGADGFGFAPEGETYKKIPQIGNVVLEESVEIGANTCVDRATMGTTTIRKGTKLDNLIQIGHNVTIGENCVFASQSGVAGSTSVGNHCMLGGQVGVAGHSSIADRTIVASQSGVASSIKEGGKTWFGTPIMEMIDSKRSFIIYKTLPEMSRKVSKLEKEIEELKKLLTK